MIPVLVVILYFLLAVVCVPVSPLLNALRIVVHPIAHIIRDDTFARPMKWLCDDKVPDCQHAMGKPDAGLTADPGVVSLVRLSTPLTVVRYNVARELLRSDSGNIHLRGKHITDERLHVGYRVGGKQNGSTWTRRTQYGTAAATDQNFKVNTGRSRIEAGRGSSEIRRTGFGKPKTPGGIHSSKINVHQIRGELSIEGGSDDGDVLGFHGADRVDLRAQSEGRDHCPLPFGVLSTMLDGGLNWDQLQTAIFAEYGTTLSVSALKRRLSEERSDRAGTRRTGKTRRERKKERQRRWTASDSVSVLVRANERTTVAALARMLGQDVTDIIDYVVRREGSVATADSILRVDVLARVCEAFGAEMQWLKGPEDGIHPVEALSDSLLRPLRPPIVAVMGHVDHGKTSLLDRLRSSSVAASEAGGITQSLSAFQVIQQMRAITFIDTPGHSAFAAMRRRGAAVTDVVVLVVAADDGVMQQTKECISAARAANCPIVVAINKVDKEGASVDAVWTALAQEGLLVEELGGDVQCALVSAKTGTGMEDLLDKIQLQAELLDIRADAGQDLTGAILEARKDKKLGTVATVIVQTGTLRVGDTVVAGQSWGKVKKLLSCTGTVLEHAGPSTPVQVVGLTGTPPAGASVTVVNDAELARAVVLARRDLEKEQLTDRSSAAVHESATTDLLSSPGGSLPMRQKKLSLVVKADTAGSLEALCSAVTAPPYTDHREVDIIFRGLGDVSTSDVTMTSATSEACIVAYNVGWQQDAYKLCRSLGRATISSPVIYDVLDSLTGLQDTTVSTIDVDAGGRLSVKHVFPIGKGGKVAGCQLTDGTIRNKDRIRILRGDTTVHEGVVTSLKIGKQTVVEVAGRGSECGLTVEGFVDFLIGDVIEVLSNA